METTISDLSPDLVEEILTRVPLTSLRKVRSTSKQWDALSKDRIVCKAKSKQHFLGFMIRNVKIYSVRFNLQNNYDGKFGDSSIKKTRKLNKVRVAIVYHCDGLVLCETYNHKRLVASNPYLGQTRFIEAKNANSLDVYGIGYDSSRSYKILRFLDGYFIVNGRVLEYEIYDFDSDSWRVLDVIPDWYIGYLDCHGVSLNGNTYWIAEDRRRIEAKDKRKNKEVWVGEEVIEDDFLLCFDFTRERFGPRLELPSRDGFKATGVLASVREEQLAAIFQHSDSFKTEIWVTTKIDPKFVSWIKFLEFDMTPSEGLRHATQHGSFFIHKENKVAWFFYRARKNNVTPGRNIAYMIGEDGFDMEINLQESRHDPIVCSSLVQIELTPGD